MKVVLAALVACLVTVTAASSAGSVAATASCTGGQLSGRFALIPGSPGAGSVSYRLTLRNVSARACTLTGLPRGRLVGKTGTLLPTHIVAAFPGALTAVLVTLAPRASAHADARFSPDVPGPGEQHPGACEPVAYRFRVAPPGGGTTTVAVSPPTSVCEHGSLRFGAYGR